MKQIKNSVFLFTFIILGVFSQVTQGDSLTSDTGEVLRGKIWEYDELSYIVIFEQGGKVVVPRNKVKEVNWEDRKDRKYSKEAKSIVSENWIEENEERVLVAELIDREAGQKGYRLKEEARILQDLLQSERKYAKVYRTAYRWGWDRYELEYQWEKDLLLRRVHRMGRGTKVRILGPTGQGKDYLERAVQGKIQEEDRGILDRIQEPAKMPHEQKVRIDNSRNKTQDEEDRKGSWYE